MSINVTKSERPKKMVGLSGSELTKTIIVGSSNAVNLTDGLDGLATVPIILVAGCFAFISYVTGNIIFSEYLKS